MSAAISKARDAPHSPLASRQGTPSSRAARSSLSAAHPDNVDSGTDPVITNG